MFAKETNLEAVRRAYNLFLNVPVRRDDKFGMGFVIHPVFDDTDQFFRDDNGDLIETVNILQSPENFEKAKARKREFVAEADNVISIGLHLRKGYRLNFLEHIENDLSLEDFSIYLAAFWGDSDEEATSISGVKKSKAKQWLSACDKDVFMEGEMKRLFDSFGGEVTVYRGATDITKRNLKSALTWTISYDDAVWYAERYLIMGIDKSYVYQATIDKAHIYGCVYTESSDVVVDNKGLRDITLIKTYTL